MLADNGNMTLRTARRARGLTQQQLAAHVGVSRQALGFIEQGKHNPSLPVALRLARALHTTVEALFPLAATEPDPDADSTQLRCPKCGAATLRLADRGRVQVWTCAACGHTWRTRSAPPGLP
jgi:putative transcriptional regulator